MKTLIRVDAVWSAGDCTRMVYSTCIVCGCTAPKASSNTLPPRNPMSTLTSNLNPYPNVLLSIPALARNAAGKGVNGPRIVKRQLDQREARTSDYLGNMYLGILEWLRLSIAVCTCEDGKRGINGTKIASGYLGMSSSSSNDRLTRRRMAPFVPRSRGRYGPCVHTAHLRSSRGVPRYSDRPIFKQEKQKASAAMPPKGHYLDDARLEDGTTKPPRYSNPCIVVATFCEIHACVARNTTKSSCPNLKSSESLAVA